VNIWLLIAGCVVTTVLIKAVGPVMLGGRDLPPVVLRVIACMAPALLAALVVTSVFADGQSFRVGAEAVGVAAGGAVLLRGRSVVLAVVVAMAVTAALRAVS
jgi:branched-subunit amino acid transport protein